MFANMRLNFHGDHMPLLATMLPPPQAAIAGERVPSSDPNIASSSRPHESIPDLFTSTNVEDDTMGGSFHSSPPRSTQAPPEGTTSGGAEDLDKLTTLSSLVSTLVQKVNTQESDLKAHKLLFKEVVGKLVKRVKLLEDKLKGRKRKVVLTDSDKEEDAELDVDPLIKLAKAAATADATSDVPTGGSHDDEISTWQREEDRLGEEAARRLYEEEKAELEREKEEMKKKRQKDVMDSYFSDDQLKAEFDKIRAAVGELKSQNIRRSLKRPEEVAAPSHSQDIPDTQVEVPSHNAPSAQHTASSPKKVGTRKKQLGRKGVHTSHSTISIEDGDPEAEHKRCIKYSSDADSDSDADTPVNFYDVVDWELLPTGLGSINVFYKKDNSRKCFTSLREILYLVTQADLMTIYGCVMTFYQDTQAAGVGLVLWGDLKVLIDSPEVNDGSDVWKHQQT
ncbi:hypothetical protein Tco_0868938 [Tanacetum coccineum]